MDAEVRPSRKVGVLLWIVAFLLTAVALVYQRMTGPTHPMRVTYDIGTEQEKARLLRSGTTGEDALVRIPAPPEGWTGRLVWKRYPTEDPHTATVMLRKGDELEGRLPPQPPAGKVQYRVELQGPAGASVRLPADEAEDPILRFKNAVPTWVWLPHVLAMFIGLLFAFRAGSAALLARPEARPLAWLTLGTLFVGGLVLGPIMQKIAFGAYWTGWPLGGDLTDNKLLVAWLAWAGACLVLWRRADHRDRVVRTAVVVASLVTLVIFMIPHSARGSELDYKKLKEVEDPADAVRTG